MLTPIVTAGGIASPVVLKATILAPRLIASIYCLLLPGKHFKGLSEGSCSIHIMIVMLSFFNN